MDGDRDSAMNIHLSLTYPVISTLEICLCGGCLRLMEFEEELVHSLEESSELESVEGAPSDWNIGCQHHWDHVKAVLRRIHRLEAKLYEAVESSQPSGALKMWEELLRQEARLAFALGGLHSHAAHLNEVAGREWNTLVIMVASHRKIVQTDIQKMHAQLQSWIVQESQNEVSVSITRSRQEPLWKIEEVDDMSPSSNDWEFDQAAIEIAEEQHQALGLADGMKALFMWVESPEERLLKSHDRALTRPREFAL